MKNPLSNEDYISRVTPKNEDIRGHFFRDQTIIIHSMAFRRLKHKTQVFFKPQSDHICVRLEHVLHVSTIAASICKGLGLQSSLAQAIALGHDLGHSPFGHAGESALNNIIKNEDGFKHEVHSLRMVDKLAKDGNGLNLTYAVRDGIVSHCGESFEQSIEPFKEYKNLSAIKERNTIPTTFEGCVVRLSDKIAYLGRDIEDALAAKLIKIEDIPQHVKKVLGSENSEIISVLVEDVIETSKKTGKISLSDDIYEKMNQLKDFNYEYIYGHSVIKDYITYCTKNINIIYDHLKTISDKYNWDIKGYLNDNNNTTQIFGKYLERMKVFYSAEKTSFNRIIVDFIAGMTDNFADKCVHYIVFPKAINFYL